jgi:Asp/Glu/hydantoin racemase
MPYQYDIDERHFTDHKYETRNEEVWANLAPGFLKRVRECSESLKYDTIVCRVPIDEGAITAQFVSKIPVALALHSAVHFASFIGDLFSIIDISDHHGPRQRHLVQNYGLNHKLMSIRTIDRTSTNVMRLVRQYPKAERAGAPEIGSIIADAVARASMPSRRNGWTR